MVLVRKIRKDATYANVVAMLALFVALGGSAYAALKIDSGDIKNRSIKGIDVAKNTLGGAQVKESKLGKVPNAATADNAEAIQGTGLNALKVQCPPDTHAHAGVCIEQTDRLGISQRYIDVARDCADDQRRLPTAPEMATYLLRPEAQADPHPYFTGDLSVTPNAQVPAGDLKVLIVEKREDGVFVDAQPTGRDLADVIPHILMYRCVALPSN